MKDRRSAWGVGFGGLVVALVALGAGCSGIAAKRPEPEPFAPHIVESQRLRSVMKQLLALVPEDPDTIALGPTDIETVRREIRTTSLALADQAQSVRNALSRRELPASQRERFLALADALRERATALGDDAATLPAAALRERFDGIVATCNACHDEFRGGRDG